MCNWEVRELQLFCKKGVAQSGGGKGSNLSSNGGGRRKSPFLRGQKGMGK